MSIFVERFVLPILAACVTGVILLNPLKWDRLQRISLFICVVSLAYFVAHTLNKNTKAVAPQPVPQQTGNATTRGSNSPAVTGNGNSFTYDKSEPKKEAPKKKE